MWAMVGHQAAVLERVVDFVTEFSIVAARGLDGAFVPYGAIENTHRHHILDLSVAPARMPPQAVSDAVAITQAIMEELAYVGVLCVEFFLTADGRVLVNEVAPRPHNSGHLTFDACVTSQFEQQVRAVCGLPLGATTLLRPAAMVNLLGDLWSRGEPRWAAALAVPDVKLHLYGKSDPRPGRKMGHLTAMSTTHASAVEHVLAARDVLARILRMLAFGPFRLDLRTYVLSKNGVMVPLSPKLAQVLACLADARGELITRELLLDRFWPDVNVTDNTLTRAIADIRKVLDDDPATPTFIQTLARRGYRFIAPVRAESAPADPAQPGVVAVSNAIAGLEPFVAWERGRAALESLSVAALPGAAEAFSRAVTGAPQYAPAHAGLANAHIFRYEATRVDNVPDVGALVAAIESARRATEIDPSLGEGWAALGHAWVRPDARRRVERRYGRPCRSSRATGVTSTIGDRHVGEERLRAVERAEALLPGFAPCHTLSAMVLIARQSLELAADTAARGAAAQIAQRDDRTLYPASGLLWLRGLTAFALGHVDRARADFHAEADASSAQATVYARECVVVARVAEGFALVASGQRQDARALFTAAHDASPGYARAQLGLALIDGQAPATDARVLAACAELERGRKHNEHRLLLAAAHAWGGDGAAALALAHAVLTESAPDATGWSLPADPMFTALRMLPGYARLASHLASRAS